MLASVNGLVLLWVVSRAAGLDGLDQRVSVRMSKPGDRIAGRDDIGEVGLRLIEHGGFDDAVFGRFEGVIEPSGEKIADCKFDCQS